MTFPWRFRQDLCIYGHFNRYRGIGVKKYYPHVKQFITILRDPFERAVSEYFYLRKDAENRLNSSQWLPSDSLEQYLEEVAVDNIKQFPERLDIENFKDKLQRDFIHIGITEDLPLSLKIIADKLGMAPPSEIPSLNVTERTQHIPYDLKPAFVRRHPLEYALYDYAQSIYDKY